MTPWVESLGEEEDLGDEDDGEQDGSQPLDPELVNEENEGADQGADQEAHVDRQGPKANLLAALVLKEDVVDDGEAHGRDGSEAEALEEASGDISTVGRGGGGANGGGEGHDGAENEDDAPADGISQRGPDERAECEAEGRDCDGPVGLSQGDAVVSHQVGKGGHRCSRDVGEGEVSGHGQQVSVSRSRC